jgi:hypothetical protein
MSEKLPQMNFIICLAFRESSCTVGNVDSNLMRIWVRRITMEQIQLQVWCLEYTKLLDPIGMITIDWRVFNDAMLIFEFV